MKKMQFLPVAGIAGVALIGALAWAGPKQGKVAPWDAMKTAVAKVGGGRAHQATYAVENGKPIYDVIVIQGKKLTEVEVDALTPSLAPTWRPRRPTATR